MKKILLQEDLSQYKANLHCHTVISDGKLTPGQVKEAYMRHGYSVVAFTDHDVMIPHPQLCDESFLALTGYEMEVNEANVAWPKAKCCHICLIALSADIEKQVCFHRNQYFIGNGADWKQQAQYDADAPDYVRQFTPQCINDMIRQGRENGFFVTYNHPCWSREDYRDYTAYHGMNAMEMVNYGCVIEGYDDHNGRVYDDMLRAGERLFCIAADDNHNAMPESDPRWDSCGAYTVILAKNLQYRTITKALEDGSFYASEGPRIFSLTLEDGKVTVVCSPCEKISCMYDLRRGQLAAADCEEGITQAQFTVQHDDTWFRLELRDSRGRTAYTNAYFLK